MCPYCSPGETATQQTEPEPQKVLVGLMKQLRHFRCCCLFTYTNVKCLLETYDALLIITYNNSTSTIMFMLKLSYIHW